MYAAATNVVGTVTRIAIVTGIITVEGTATAGTSPVTEAECVTVTVSTPETIAVTDTDTGKTQIARLITALDGVLSAALRTQRCRPCPRRRTAPAETVIPQNLRELLLPL